MRRLRKIVLWILLPLLLLALLVSISAIVVFQTDWFKNKVRGRIVSEIERATGGRVEIGRFNYSWSNFTAEVTPLTVHGTEAPGAPPLFRAARIEVGLKIVSILAKKVDIASLKIEKPDIRILVNPDGSTNIPYPALKPDDVVDAILNLKIQRLTVANGFVQYNSKRIPLDLRAGNVSANLRYLSSPSRYVCEIASHQLHMMSTNIRDASFDFQTSFTLQGGAIQIQSATLARNRSTIQFAGTVLDFASPRANLEIQSHLYLPDFAGAIKLPIENRGEIAFNGKAALTLEPLGYNIEGRLNGRGLAYASRELGLRNFAFMSKIAMTPGNIHLPDVDLAAIDGHFRGSVIVTPTNRFRVEGTIAGVSVQQLAALQRLPTSQLNGALTGPVQAEGILTKTGIADLKSHATLQITPGPTGVPVKGSVEVNYDEHTGIVQLGDWSLLLGASHLTASGNLGQRLTIHLTSPNLNDLLLALPLVGKEAPEKLPIKLLQGGTATFDGTITGALQNPKLSGRLQLTAFEFDKRRFTHLDSEFDATKSNLNVRSLAVDGEWLHATASGQMGLFEWLPQENSPVQASLRVRGVDIKNLSSDTRLTGTVNATAAVTGSYGSPNGTAHVQVDNATAFDEPFTRVVADLNFSDRTIEAHAGRATAGKAALDFGGTYQHSAADWTTGQLRFQVSTRGFTLAQIKNVSNRREGVDGSIDLQATGNARFIKSEVQLDNLDSQVSIRNAIVDGKPMGNLTGTAKTRGDVLDISADADLRSTQVHGSGEWRLTGDYPGCGKISFPKMALSTLRDLLPSQTGKALPFGGFLSANVNVSGPLKKIDAMRAEVTVPELQINASSETQPRAGAQPQDLILRSAAPLVFDVTTKGMDIRSAQFRGTDTTLQSSGRIAFGDAGLWNLHFDGSINLAILQLFNPDLLASGVSTLNATVRGTLNQPDLGGRLELKNASLYLADFPNGVTKANGLIVFDRNRATIEKLSAESGGGAVVFQAGSFIGFSGSTLIYRVQAAAERVRYRSPEGVSITANANLSLSGTSRSSMLSGTVSVTRAAFTPQTDVGSLLASTAKPLSVPAAANLYVRGIQFDVRIDSAQSLEVTTTLARDIQVDASLRLRGNVERPILLGNISVNEGQIDFFGNKYTINVGEVTFLNPAKIEPVVNMDLETRVRGITVDITFAGPLDKLAFSYRSDPPLESNQIIALLAVGRQPVGGGALASAQTTTNTSYLAAGTNEVLQQAIAAPASGRLQRFFGVSHIKIDPQLTDITSVPQARLTLEQQISKDITLTYITNLSRTSEQVVRVEWNFSRRWSVVAVRDENGLFGIDFQYRKTFK